MRSDSVFPPEFPPHRLPSEPTTHSMPIPVVYEETDLGGISLRAYAAIQLRVPESGIQWLDKMILKAREMDREQALAIAREAKKRS